MLVCLYGGMISHTTIPSYNNTTIPPYHHTSHCTTIPHATIPQTTYYHMPHTKYHILNTTYHIPPYHIPPYHIPYTTTSPYHHHQHNTIPPYHTHHILKTIYHKPHTTYRIPQYNHTKIPKYHIPPCHTTAYHIHILNSTY